MKFVKMIKNATEVSNLNYEDVTLVVNIFLSDFKDMYYV